MTSFELNTMPVIISGYLKLLPSEHAIGSTKDKKKSSINVKPRLESCKSAHSLSHSLSLSLSLSASCFLNR